MPEPKSLAPYRTPSLPPRPSLWQRIKCMVGKHDWEGPPQPWALGEFMPCRHCSAKFTRVRDFYSVERGDLPRNFGDMGGDPLPPRK